MSAAVDMTGETWGRLYVVGHDVPRIGNRRALDAVCSCGARFQAPVDAVRSGRTRSCGCLRIEVASSRVLAIEPGGAATHGMSWTPTWKIWCGMRKRCSDRATGQSRRDYFDRGIRVCERWQAFEHFFADMGERPGGMSLDRYPNMNGNYEPGNCRWATQSEQMRNTRATRWIEHDGLRLSLIEWGEQLDIDPSIISTRLRRGWSVDRALTVGVRTPSPKAVGL